MAGRRMKDHKGAHPKSEPITIALSFADRETLTLTAAIFGTDLAGYARQLLRRRAQAIRRRSTITLSQRDMRAFAEELRRPARPNAALRRAVQEYRRFRISR
jgi:uncharacterized protein (DUF1778 family)